MLKWNKEHYDLKQAVDLMAMSLNENVLEFENRGEFPRSKWEIISKVGLLGVPVQEQFGGLEQDVLTTMFLLEALGHACEDGGLNFTVSSHIVSTTVPIQKFGSDTQKAKYLPRLVNGSSIGAHAITEPGSGSDAFNMRTVAKKINGKYLLTGSKTFITNSLIADLFVVYAATDKQKGALGGISAFIIEKGTPGLTIGKPMEKMGLRTSVLSEIFLDDCEVPDKNLLGTPGNGFSIFNYVMKWEILCSFAINIGEMEKQLEKCIEYSRTRKQFGQPISKYQSIAHKIVDMKIRLETSRELLYKAGACFGQGANAGMEIAIAKVVTSESYVQSSLDAIQIFGAYGYMKEYLIEKDLRNAVAGKIYSGSSEIQRNMIGSYLGL